MAQDSLKLKFWDQPESVHQPRYLGVTGTTVGLFGTAMIGLNEIWYADFPKSKFHFFDDSKEWMQIDKIGHGQASYFQSRWMYHLYRWAGVNNKNATWHGLVGANVLQLGIEVLDGHSAEWGASWSDIGANFSGSILFALQQWEWGEQRISFKYNMVVPVYPNDIKFRTDDLYGTAFMERALKDYNGQTYWLSFNIASFLPDDSYYVPSWLNIAVGYSAEGMLGGFENSWELDNGVMASRYDIERYRQFFISPDVDFTRIPTSRKGVKAALEILNIIKFPAPALEINTKGKVVLHPMYILNFHIPAKY